MKASSAFVYMLLATSNISSASASTSSFVDELFLNSEIVPCTVAEVHGMAPPGSPHVAKQYTCTTDNGIPLFFDGDASALLGSGTVVPGSTRLGLTVDAMSYTNRNRISVNQAMTAPGAVSIIASADALESTTSSSSTADSMGGVRHLTQTGTKTVLVIRVESAAYSPSQSEAQLYDDIFNDENNLRARYLECSNNQLTFNPATGTNVNNGVLTVVTTTDLDNLIWGSCGDIAISGATGITRDFTMIICPDVVNFDGAAAWGQMPGSVSWYLSAYASAPIVQVHEVGHNLGHPHSGEFATYDDPTCNMGNRGSWSDTGSAFCFNGVKTWRNGWHSAYHRDINPVSATHDGSLYGINAVNDALITTSDDVVWRVYTSGAAEYIYVMFNRAAGPNRSVPGSGDQVIVHKHSGSTYDNSYIVASLSGDQSYTYSNWVGTESLVVSVCSVTLGTPGVARVLVYTSGNPLSCAVATPAPTKKATSAPTKSPVQTPTAPKTSSPTRSPVQTPTAPKTSSPTKSPVQTPTAPKTSSPTKSPVQTPTAPKTSSPTKSPIMSPDPEFCQDSSSKFNYLRNQKKNCVFIARANTESRCLVEGVADACPVTCQVGCQCFDTSGRFQRGKKLITCAWVGRKNRLQRCRNNVARANCPITCGVC